ncbi:hypothetical protein AOXY_G22778 [Acipenser oxyrinchus oxyrinchus]|uniref:Uncharacterized protein n=1 Tax=Acipenser oxyrinchus oxyrinchus TaxID=40147 RepID=A0AAD8D0T0_ACIOX|nr:hypothetical protein AOXY_G22778 [Acipenser oxyrinchus oxyrinchus]
MRRARDKKNEAVGLHYREQETLKKTDPQGLRVSLLCCVLQMWRAVAVTPEATGEGKSCHCETSSPKRTGQAHLIHL